MKKSKLLVLASIIVFAFASCSKNEYVKVIPADAKIVASVDFKSIAEKCDFDSNKKVLESLKTMAALQDSPKEVEYTKKLIDDPSMSGLDVAEPAYLFVTGDRSFFGFLCAVDSKSKLEDFYKTMMPNMLPKFKEKDGVKYVVDGNGGMAYDGDAFLALFKTGIIESNLEVKMTELFKKENPFTETAVYDKFDNAEGDAKLWLNLGIFPSELFEASGTDITSMTGGVKMKDINLLGTLTFDKGEVRAEFESFGSDAESQKKLEAKAAKSKLIAGDYLNLATVDCIGWFGASVDGKEMLSNIEGNSRSKEGFIMIEQMLGLDVLKMLGSFSGDCAAAFNCKNVVEIETSEQFFDHFVVAAKVANADFMADFDKNFKADDVIVTPVEGNIYKLDVANEKHDWDWETGDVTVTTVHNNFIFGVNPDNNLVFTGLNGFSPNLFVGTTSALDKYKGEIKESTGFFFLDMKKLMSSIMKNTGMANNMPSEAKKAIDLLDVFVVKGDNKLHGSARLTVTDNSKNILALYVGLINEFFENNM